MVGVRAAHFFTFWAFVVLAATILEAYGALFDRDFAIPVIGHWGLLGFLEDFFAVAVLVSLASSPSSGSATRRPGAARVPVLRLAHRCRLAGAPHDLPRHLTLLLYRGAQINTGVFPFGDGGVRLTGGADLLEPLGEDANEALETVGILLQIVVVLGFLVLVVYSKHLHIFLAPLNVLTKREPNALGALLPIMVTASRSTSRTSTTDEDDVFGRGKVEDFTWKGMLDFATCTECGRCQDQCPAWNTGKPLSPKLVIMDLRDHLFAKAPYLRGRRYLAPRRPPRPARSLLPGHGVPESGFGRVRPEQASGRWSAPSRAG